MRWLFLLLLVLNLFYLSRWELSDSRPSTEDAGPVFSRESGQALQLVAESAVGGRKPAIRQKKEECLSLGSLQSEERGHQLVQRLLSLDIRSAVEEVERVVSTDYWLYLPPLASRQESLHQWKDLQAKKIDSYIIGQGDLANGISLGVFSRAESAEAAMRHFKAAGYEPAMRELPKTKRDYWVVVAPESSRLLDERVMAILAKSFPGLSYQKMACKGLADPARFE